MAKKTTQLALMLPPREAGAPAICWLYSTVRAAILEGRLRPGARLPATRELARQHRLARGTVVMAFDQLKAEGYLDATMGSGTYVARVLPERLLQAARSTGGSASTVLAAPRSLSGYGQRIRAFRNLEPGRARPFRANQPALDLFPTALWTQVATRRLRRVSKRLLQVCDPLGHRPLQEAVATYLATSRGVRCEPGQVAIVSGVQEALDLATRLFVDPGDRVAIEDPGYPGASLVFTAYGAEIAPIPVDAEGMVLDPAQLKGARLVYVTPAHQFPTGVSMTPARRLALLEWARSSGALLFEDDHDSEYRYAGRPLPALQGSASHGQVLFAGSFSKVLFPSLRLGYVVLPDDLVDRFAAMQSVTHRHAPLLEQAVLADFITAGHFGRHIRRMREVYAERLSVLVDSVRSELAGALELSNVEAGLQTTAWLERGLDAEAVAHAASERDVEVTPLGRYARRPLARAGLQLGFAAVDPRELRRGVRDLAVAVEVASRLGARGCRSGSR